MYQEKFFFLCKIPLSARSPEDVTILKKAENTMQFPELFNDYEELRSHAFNEDNLFSIIRADELHLIIRVANNENLAKEVAFEEARPNLITNLQHKVMQSKDKTARDILKEVHNIDIAVK